MSRLYPFTSTSIGSLVGLWGRRRLNGGGAVHKAARLTAVPLTVLGKLQSRGSIAATISESLVDKTIRSPMSEHTSGLDVEAMERQQEMQQIDTATKVCSGLPEDEKGAQIEADRLRTRLDL